MAMGAGPAHALYFASYETTKSAIGTATGLPDTHPIVSGNMASFSSLFSLSDPFSSNPMVHQFWMGLNFSFLTLFLHAGTSGILATVIHDGFMNPFDGNPNHHTNDLHTQKI